jgi:hypothetical protein
VPGANPAGFTDTLRLAGVVPLPGVTESHVPPLGVCTLATAVKLSGVLLLVTATVCDPGALIPIWNANDSVVGLADSTGCAVTISVTITVTGLLAAPGAVIVIVPV